MGALPDGRARGLADPRPSAVTAALRSRLISMDNTFDVIVVGAGASGLAAAVEAARAGASVLALEKNHVPGRKILSTGAGKCNFSNRKVKPAAYHGAPAAFLRETFAALPPAAVLSFFEGLGLLWTEGEDGKLFPRSMRAQDVVGVLMNELVSRAVPVRTLMEAVSVKPSGCGFEVEAQRVPPQWEKKGPRGEKTSLRAARVVLAAGGPCYPQIGGTSGGYELLRRLGHTVTPLSPAIAPLKARCERIKELDGVRLQAALTLLAEGRRPARSEGELLFTDYGVSGPAALDLSREALAALKAGPVSLAADLFPDYSPGEMSALLRGRAAAFAGRPFSHFACGLHNEKLLKVCAARCGIGWQAPAPQAAEGKLDALASLLKAFTLELTGTLGFEDAMVTAGGCPVSEVDPVSFASKKVPGLFVTGELVDADGDSGGYNLHLAWTSGILAGRAAARK